MNVSWSFITSQKNANIGCWKINVLGPIYLHVFHSHELIPLFEFDYIFQIDTTLVESRLRLCFVWNVSSWIITASCLHDRWSINISPWFIARGWSEDLHYDRPRNLPSNPPELLCICIVRVYTESYVDSQNSLFCLKWSQITVYANTMECSGLSLSRSVPVGSNRHSVKLTGTHRNFRPYQPALEWQFTFLFLKTAIKCHYCNLIQYFESKFCKI